MNKIKVLNEENIKEILNLKIAIDADKKAYSEKSNGKGKVWPLVFHEYEHNVFDLDIRSGNLDDTGAYGLKLISYNENNPKKGLPKVYGTSLIFDSKTGAPIALLNAAPITFYRTGAAAAVGCKYLARKESENLLIIGCGNIATYSLAATLLVMPNIKKVVIANPKNENSLKERFDEFKKNVERLLNECNEKLEAEIVCSTNLENDTKNSDIIITATSSYNPLIDVSWVKEGTHFSCIGACMEGQQEIDEKIFNISKCFADDKEQCKKTGEAEKAFKEKIINDFNGEIGEVILGINKGRESNKDITIFDSTGLFIQDLATAVELLKKAKNVGIEIEL